MAEEAENVSAEIKWFTCSACNLKQQYDIKGTGFPFMKYVTLKEESYILKDPFTEPDKKNILILGSDCCMCGNQVCQSGECSIYYKRRFCHKCASQNKNVLPEQLQSKIKIRI